MTTRVMTEEDTEETVSKTVLIVAMVQGKECETKLTGVVEDMKSTTRDEEVVVIGKDRTK